MNLITFLLSLGSKIKTYVSAFVALISALVLIFGGNWVAGIPALLIALKAIFVLAFGATLFFLREAITGLELALELLQKLINSLPAVQAQVPTQESAQSLSSTSNVVTPRNTQ